MEALLYCQREYVSGKDGIISSRAFQAEPTDEQKIKDTTQPTNRHTSSTTKYNQQHILIEQQTFLSTGDMGRRRGGTEDDSEDVGAMAVPPKRQMVQDEQTRATAAATLMHGGVNATAAAPGNHRRLWNPPHTASSEGSDGENNNHNNTLPSTKVASDLRDGVRQPFVGTQQQEMSHLAAMTRPTQMMDDGGLSPLRSPPLRRGRMRYLEEEAEESDGNSLEEDGYTVSDIPGAFRFGPGGELNLLHTAEDDAATLAERTVSGNASIHQDRMTVDSPTSLPNNNDDSGKDLVVAQLALETVVTAVAWNESTNAPADEQQDASREQDKSSAKRKRRESRKKRRAMFLVTAIAIILLVVLAIVLVLSLTSTQSTPTMVSSSSSPLVLSNRPSESPTTSPTEYRPPSFNPTTTLFPTTTNFDWCQVGLTVGAICCPSTCGTCGGEGCSQRPGGSTECCYGDIQDAGVFCQDVIDTACIIPSDPAWCHAGIAFGSTCCSESCGTCGVTTDCHERPGGSAACCELNIHAASVFCNDETDTACIIPSDSQTPPQPNRMDLFILALHQAAPSIDTATLRDPNPLQFETLDFLSRRDAFLNSISDTELLDQPTMVLERYVLTYLYFATAGSGWTDEYRFQSPNSVCEWTNNNLVPLEHATNLNVVEGVGCDEVGAVSSLYLARNSLGGNLPTELALLTALSVLELDNNSLTGTIPTEYGLLTSLKRLRLWTNNLSGRIPTELGGLAQLGFLSLATVGLRGTLPTELGLLTDLTLLSLSSNNYSGHIPSELGALTGLTALKLGVNNLTGTVPTELRKLSSLTTLNLHRNNLQGDLNPLFCTGDISCGDFSSDCLSEVNCSCCTRDCTRL